MDNECWNLEHLDSTVLCSIELTRTFLFSNNLLQTSCPCISCSRECSIVVDSSITDGIIWRCPSCKKKKSIRYNSWFTGSRLPLDRILRVVYFWVHKYDQQQAGFEAGVCAETMVDFYMYCRQVCYETLESDQDMLGGPGCIIEIDEAKFGKRKFNRGARVEGVWVFGMIERGSKRCALVPVPDRTAATLTRMLLKFVRLGTTIYSDCWAAYVSLESLGYIHGTVNHSEHFKDPVTGIHTNNIEGTWNLVRRSFPRFGTTKEHYASYLIEFMFRRKYLNDKPRGEWFPIFLRKIANLSIIW